MCALMLTTVSFGEGKMSLPNSSEKQVVQEKAVGPLGDLSPFIHIAKETLKIAESGDLKGAKNRIKDLETAWHDAENKMRPMSSDDWRTADKAIDHALAKLRSGKPDQAACIEKLKVLITIFDRLQARK